MDQKNKEAVYRWRKAHPEKVREYSRRQYWKDPAKAIALRKRWEENNPDKMIEKEIKRNQKIIDNYLWKIEARKTRIEELLTQLTQCNHSTTTASPGPSTK